MLPEILKTSSALFSVFQHGQVHSFACIPLPKVSRKAFACVYLPTVLLPLIGLPTLWHNFYYAIVSLYEGRGNAGKDRAICTRAPAPLPNAPVSPDSAFMPRKTRWCQGKLWWQLQENFAAYFQERVSVLHDARRVCGTEGADERSDRLGAAWARGCHATDFGCH